MRWIQKVYDHPNKHDSITPHKISNLNVYPGQSNSHKLHDDFIFSHCGSHQQVCVKNWTFWPSKTAHANQCTGFILFVKLTRWPGVFFMIFALGFTFLTLGDHTATCLDNGSRQVTDHPPVSHEASPTDS